MSVESSSKLKFCADFKRSIVSDIFLTFESIVNEV